MFNLFKKKESTVNIIDKIWMTEAVKLQAFVDEWKKDNNIVYIFWFDDTFRKAESIFAKETTETPPLLTTREATTSTLKDKNIIFAEHYPLQQKEKELYQKLGLTTVQVWSALNEPLFLHFGGEKILQLMKQSGMAETEAVEHKMLSKSIQNAQEKIETKVLAEQNAHSQKDWIEKNLPH